MPTLRRIICARTGFACNDQKRKCSNARNPNKALERGAGAGEGRGRPKQFHKTAHLAHLILIVDFEFGSVHIGFARRAFMLTQMGETDSDELAKTVAEARAFLSLHGRPPRRFQRPSSSEQKKENKLRLCLRNYQDQLQAQGLWEEFAEPPPAVIKGLPPAREVAARNLRRTDSFGRCNRLVVDPDRSDRPGCAGANSRQGA